jgi:integrase
MPKRTLTAAAVERLKPPKSGQVDYFDSGHPGLALRVSYGGVKSWVFFHRLHGKQARLTLGRYPAMSVADARQAWRGAREMVAKGESPRPKPPTDTFEAVAEEWLKRDQTSNKSVAEVRRVIERDILPVWRGRPLADIKRRDALDLIDAIADRGATIMAHRTHAHLHRLFRWAVGRGIIEANPMANLPKPGAPVRRDRVLSDAELAAVWQAASATTWPFGPIFRLLILTGARRDEVGALRWSEIDGDTIRLTGERTKNDEPHDVPLSAEAAEIIANLPRMAGSDFVFSTTGRTPVSGWSRAKTLLDRAAAETAGTPIAPWRIHDLRRTVATGLQRLGTGLQTIEAVLGHVSGSRGGIVGVYQRHSFADEKRAALDAWSRHVASLAGERVGNVAEISSVRKITK